MTEKIVVNKLPITLVQFLKWGGLVATGGEAKDLVRNGMIYVNHQICTVFGKQLQKGDIIAIMAEDDSTAAELEIVEG